MQKNDPFLTGLREKSCRQLMALALQEKLCHRGAEFALCCIINAKSGQCSEDCRFCVQSAHYQTAAPIYPLKTTAEILAAAKEAKRIGAQHFSIVTSGRGLGRKEVGQVAAVLNIVRQEVDIALCASLGILGREEFGLLREAGLTRYHHNLESSEEFFPRVASTHTFAERVATIAAAKAEGLEVCAGGIFGLGESEDDRVSMLVTLKTLQVDSVPINILIPLVGTPLEHQPPLPVHDILRSIALSRLIMPEIPLRLAGGRETALQDFLSSAFMAGADGMMIGGYLTERGRAPEKDRLFVREMRDLWTRMIQRERIPPVG